MRQLRLYHETGSEKKNEKVECSVCRGIPRFCSVMVCPYFKNLVNPARIVTKLSGESIYGPTPPTILVGSYSYPNVRLGPLMAIDREEMVELADNPSQWINMDIMELLGIRLGLLYGNYRRNVTAARTGERLVSELQELAMSEKPVYAELWLAKKPVIRAGFQTRLAPFGPTAPARRLELTDNPYIPKVVEDVVGDVDMRAEEAVVRLYERGITENRITRLFTSGLLGVLKERRLVPTEWSITAVDDIIGKNLRNKIKKYEEISDYLLFQHEALHNRVTIALLPAPWMFEVFEFWIREKRIRGPYMDSELPMEKDKYPDNVGGAYHAVRLPVLEYLNSIKRQAAALAVIEIYPGWIPLGVWRFREIARRALSNRPLRFDDLDVLVAELVKKVGRHLASSLRRSRVLGFLRRQSTLRLRA